MDTQSLSSLSSSSSSSCHLSPCSAWHNPNPPLISQDPCISSQKLIKAGRKKYKVTRHPIYRGVRQRNGKIWVSEVRTGPKSKSRIWLGTYATPEMAARAYDAAALAIRGTMAVLNFPDSAWLLPRARSSSPRDIQVAALMAAKAFKPGVVSSSSCSSSTTLLPNKTQDKVLETSKGENKDQKVLEPLPLEIVSANKISSSDDEEVSNQYSTFFFDEEALFNMPGLLDSMAEGLILTPPAIGTRGFDWDDHDFACDMNLTLWSD